MASMTTNKPSTSPGAGLDRTLLASFLIFVGGLLLAGEFNLLPAKPAVDFWHWVMLGGGSMLLLSELVRALAVPYSQPSGARLIGGALLLGFALSSIFGLSAGVLWPAALLILGSILLARGIASRF